MKKVCPYCGSQRLHRHGNKRRKCAECSKTSRIQSGRKKTALLEQYILDRSTIARIADKHKNVPSTALYHIQQQARYCDTPVSRVQKKFEYLFSLSFA